MKHLSKAQRKILKRIKKLGTYNCTDLPQSELSVVKFLRSEGLVNAQTKDGIFLGGNAPQRIEMSLISVCISEAGKAYLSEFYTDKAWRYVTLAVSIFAAIGAYRQELALILQAIEKLLK